MNQVENFSSQGLIEGVPGFPWATEGSTMRVSLFIFSPISSAIGAPGLWYSQPLTQATVPQAGLGVLVVNAIVEIVALVSRKFAFLGSEPVALEGPPGSVTMTLPQLATFLRQIQKGLVEIPNQNNLSRPPRPGVEVQAQTFFTVFLLVTGYLEPGERTPRLSLFVPIFSLEGITGGLPILILGLIATILIRHVVPPSSSGIAPVIETKQEPKFQFSLHEILKLLRSYNSYFQ